MTTEPRTYTHTSPDYRVVVVTRVPTFVDRNEYDDILQIHYSAEVSRVLNKLVRAALENTEPDTVTHVKWPDDDHS